MHAAPPVRMSLAPGGAWHAAWVLVAAGAGASMAAWVSSQAYASHAVVAASALCAGALAAGWAFCALRSGRSAPAVLAWDGAVWQWSSGESPPVPGESRVMIDLDTWLLLRFKPSAPGRRVAWLAVSRRHAGPAWPAWRAALYARRPGGVRPMGAGPT